MTTTATEVSRPAIDPALVAAIVVGDQIRFDPRGGSGSRWWTVQARNERFIIAICPAPFLPTAPDSDANLWYTIVDLTGWTSRYNGVTPGPVRSSLNTLGGGSLSGLSEDGCLDMLDALASGRWELSRRRVAPVNLIERKN